MTGKIHYEGQEYFGNASLKGQTQSTLYLGLYQNAVELTKDQTMTSVTEVNGGGYARIPLNSVDWSIDSTKTVNGGTLFVQPRKTFLFSQGVGEVTGYFITTSSTGNTGKLLSSEHFITPANVNQPDFEIRITARNEFR